MIALRIVLYLFTIFSISSGEDVTGELPTTTEPSFPSEEYLSDNSINAVELYKNFTDTIFEVLSELGENNTETDETIIEDDAGSIASLLGLSYILASTREQDWRLSYPIFDKVMREVAWNVLDALDTVLLDIKETLHFTNILFSAPSQNIHSGSKNLLSYFEVDFEDDDVTVPFINEKLYNLTDGLLQPNYIPDGVLIPSSALGLAVNIVQTKLNWSVPLTPVGKKAFNRVEQGDFVQYHGEVRYTEDNEEIELILRFQGRKSGLALRIPKNIGQDRSVANIEFLPTLVRRNVTVQLPQLSYTLRSTYNLDDENITNCHFHKEANMLQILDVLTYVDLNSEYFQVVSVSGAQIVNVQQFIEEIRNQTDSSDKDPPEGVSRDSSTSSSSSSKPSQQSAASGADADIIETDYSYAEENVPQSSMESQKEDSVIIKIGDSTTTAASSPALSNEILPEKLIIIDRPFTWMFFDNYVVPIVAGVVTSLKPVEDTPPPQFSLLGTERNRISPYLQCFADSPNN